MVLKKEVLKISGIVLMLIGAILLYNAASGIAGRVILEDVLGEVGYSVCWFFILGGLMLFIYSMKLKGSQETQEIDLSKEFQENEIMVILCNSNYPEILDEIIKQSSSKYGKVGYITLNKPYNTLIELFKKNNVDMKKFGFIDAITKSVIKPESIKNCVFISSPNALVEMSIVIKKVSESQHPDLFIFDSLSSLLVYEKGSALIKFVHSLVESLRIHKIKIIFIALKSDTDSALIKDLSMFVDKMIKT